jgi:hypothetical protein
MASLGCERGPSVTPGDFVPAVPYLMVQSPPPDVRASLAQARWSVVRLGAPSAVALPEPVAAPAPSILGHSIAHIDLTQRRWWALLEATFGSRRPDRATTSVVDPDALRRVGLEPPSPSVWLVGPQGPCHARVARPWAALYDGPRSEVLEVSYLLDHCADQAWAPVATTAETLPEDLRWIPAVSTEEIDLLGDPTWDDPRAAGLPAPAAAPPPEAARRTITIRAVPGLALAPVQILDSWRTESTDDACASISTTATFGWSQEGSWEIDDPVDDFEHPPVLLGVLAIGDEAHAVVFREGAWAWVAVLPAASAPGEDADGEEEPLDLTPGEWTRVELATGIWPADSPTAAPWRPDVCTRARPSSRRIADPEPTAPEITDPDTESRSAP